jgi:hypothetical protein
MISGLAAPGAVEVELTAASSELERQARPDPGPGLIDQAIVVALGGAKHRPVERRPDPTVAVDALAGGKGRDKSSMAWTSLPDGAKS